MLVHSNKRTNVSLFLQLDYKVDDHKLREVFRLAGKVICAEVSKDKDGKSRGFGVVEMDHPVEAVQVFKKKNKQHVEILLAFDRFQLIYVPIQVDRRFNFLIHLLSLYR